MGRLVVVQGQGAGVEYSLEGASFILGRGNASDVQIADVKSSRKHAEVFREGDRYYLRDLASSNGTFHNGRRMTGDVLLSFGDRIAIGATVLEFVDDTAVVPAAAQAAAAEPVKRPLPLLKIGIVAVAVLAVLGIALGAWLALREPGNPEPEPEANGEAPAGPLKKVEFPADAAMKMLNEAVKLAADGKRQEALAKANEVITRYPDEPAAAEARKLIDKLKKPGETP